MRVLKILAFCLFLTVPAVVLGGVSADDLPANSAWYFHADFEEMRSSDAGRDLYAWLDDEVFEEIRENTGVDLSKEADKITAFSTDENGVVIVIDGPISKDTQDKAMVAVVAADRFETLKHGDKTFYFVENDNDGHYDSDSVHIDGIDERSYFSFAIDNRAIITSTREQMEAMLDNGGKITGGGNHNGALFILTAERSLIQAGLDTDSIDNDGEGFDSNILRNAENIAVMIADVAGNIAIEAQLVAAEAEMAESLASIARGLISLASFSDEIEPELVAMLQSTKIDVEGKALKIKLAIDPELLVAALEDH